MRLYEELQKLMGDLSESEGKSKMKSIMNKLNEGKKVQDASCSLMSFLVQDFLDYA